MVGSFNSPGKIGGVWHNLRLLFIAFYQSSMLKSSYSRRIQITSNGGRINPPLGGVLNHGFPKLLKKMPENENANNFQKIKKSS